MEQFRQEAKMFQHLDGTHLYMSGGTLYVFIYRRRQGHEAGMFEHLMLMYVRAHIFRPARMRESVYLHIYVWATRRIS